MSDNPARVAAASPEDRQLSPGVHAVGVGPGDPSYLTEKTTAVLAAADVVVGFERVTDLVTDRTSADVLSCSYDDQADVLETFASRVDDGDAGVAVLWGDPNVSGYQFLGRVEATVDAAVRVVPGVSSIQVAASRARTPLEHATVASLHRRGSIEGDLERLARRAGERHLLVIVRPYDWMPPDVADALLTRGVDPHLDAVVLQELTLATESIERTTLEDLASRNADEYSDLSILVVRRTN